MVFSVFLMCNSQVNIYWTAKETHILHSWYFCTRAHRLYVLKEGYQTTKMQVARTVHVRLLDI